MRYARAVVLAVLVLFTLAVSPAFGKPNFAGNWKLNVDKSDFGQFPPPASLTQQITHEDPAMKLTVKMSTDNGDFDFEMVISTDGKETTNTIGESEMKSVAKWDGDTLVVKTKGTFGDNEVTIDDKYTLSGDGKTLTQVRHFASAQGELDQKLIFEKQ